MVPALPSSFSWYKNRRILLTLLGLSISLSITTSLFTFIDSYSLVVWDSETDVGPAAIVVTGDDVDQRTADILSVAGVTRVASLTRSSVYAAYKGVNPPSDSVADSEGSLRVTRIAYGGYEPPPPESFVIAASLSEGFTVLFPTILHCIQGRFPEMSTEVAVVDWLASGFGVSLNGTLALVKRNPASETLHRIVGIYTQPQNSSRYRQYYTIGDVVVTPDMLGTDQLEIYAYVDVDRSPLSPLGTSSSLSYLAGIDESIRRLDPAYTSTSSGSQYSVSNGLAQGIQRYMSWTRGQHATVALRTSGYLALQLIGTMTAVSYNVTRKRNDSAVLSARGASRWQLAMRVHSELLILSTISVLPALVLGLVFSRLGMSSSSYLQLDFAMILEAPLLLSSDSLVQIIGVALAVPALIAVSMSGASAAKRSVGMRAGRLSRIVAVIGLIRWEVIAIAGSLLVVGALGGMADAISQQTLLSSALVIAPFVFYGGAASLLVKGMRAFSVRFLPMHTHRASTSPARIGFKRAGHDARPLGLAIAALALALSLVWTASLNQTTLPNTTLAQTRFAIGGDAAFKLDHTLSQLWGSFEANVTSSGMVRNATIISIETLYLSTSILSSTPFVGVDAEEYGNVGFNHLGIPIDESSLQESLVRLSQNETGAVVTSDICERYGLDIGDSLKGFLISGIDYKTFTFNIVDIVENLPDVRVTSSGYEPPSSSGIGKGRVWVNIDYLSTLFDLESTAVNFLCVRLTTGSEGLQLVSELTRIGGAIVYDVTGYALAWSEMVALLNNRDFRTDRAADTMLMVPALLVFCSAIGICSAGIYPEWQRESALLRSIGAETSALRRLDAWELLGLGSAVILLSLATTPVITVSTLIVSAGTYGAVSSHFPVTYLMSLSVPVTLVATCLCMGIASSLFMKMRGRAHVAVLAASLDAAWTRVPSLGGDM